MMQKKGIFFTLAALILVSLLFITYTFYTEINKTKSVRQRVETMNTFLVSLEEEGVITYASSSSFGREDHAERIKLTQKK